MFFFSLSTLVFKSQNAMGAYNIIVNIDEVDLYTQLQYATYIRYAVDRLDIASPKSS